MRLDENQKKIRGKTSQPHEIKRQTSADSDAMLSRIFQTNQKIQLVSKTILTSQQDHDVVFYQLFTHLERKIVNCAFNNGSLSMRRQQSMWLSLIMR